MAVVGRKTNFLGFEYPCDPIRAIVLISVEASKENYYRIKFNRSEAEDIEVSL